MKLTVAECTQVEVLIADGTTDPLPAGGGKFSIEVKPVSYTELLARRRANLEKRRG